MFASVRAESTYCGAKTTNLMNKNDLSERDICSKSIGPSIKRADSHPGKVGSSLLAFALDQYLGVTESADVS